MNSQVARSQQLAFFLKRGQRPQHKRTIEPKVTPGHTRSLHRPHDARPYMVHQIFPRSERSVHDQQARRCALIAEGHVVPKEPVFEVAL